MTEQETRKETNTSTRRAGLAHDPVRTSNISPGGKSLSPSSRTIPEVYNQDALLFPLTSPPPISDNGPPNDLPRHRLLLLLWCNNIEYAVAFLNFSRNGRPRTSQRSAAE